MNQQLDPANPQPGPGVYHGVPHYDYRQWPYPSKSSLFQLIDDSPAQYQWDKAHPKEKAAFEKGRGFHTLGLEPENFNDVLVFDGAKSRTAKAYKVFRAENPTANIILQSELYDIEGMAAALATKKRTRDIFKHGETEVSFVWDDEETGIRLKGRADFLWGLNVVDLKMSRDPRPKSFSRDIYDYGYDVQTIYMHGLNAAQEQSGVPKSERRVFNNFVFVAVKSSPVYDLRVYWVRPSTLMLGWERFRTALAIYKQCIDTDMWPGWAEEYEEIGVPAWALPDEIYMKGNQS
jgi:exodeoxyribonuclease VIII